MNTHSEKLSALRAEYYNALTGVSVYDGDLRALGDRVWLLSFACGEITEDVYQDIKVMGEAFACFDRMVSYLVQNGIDVDGFIAMQCLERAEARLAEMNQKASHPIQVEI
jgi:hypothetical protein